MPHYTRSGLKISGNRSYGFMNPHLKFLALIINSKCLKLSIKHGGGSVMMLHSNHCCWGLVLKSVSLAMASFLSITMIPKTLPMQ